MSEERTNVKFKCKTCGKRFSRNQNLQSHILTHSGYKRFKCKLCEKKFTYGHELKTHINMHNGIRPYKCKICDRSFLRSTELKIHMNSTIHAGIKPWKCTKCKKKFAQHAHLQAHIRSHTGETPYRCKLCPKAFTQSSHLNSHLLLHSGEKPHQCKICKQRYRLKTTLNSHLRTHTGDRPYKCSQCSKAYTQQTPLSEHIQKVHENRTFPCTFCDKSFPSKNQIKRHEKMCHLGDFRYRCVFCGKGIHDGCGLHNHIRRHIQERPFFCGFCNYSCCSSNEKARHEKRHKKRRQKRRTKGKQENEISKESTTNACVPQENFVHKPAESLSPLPPLLVKQQETAKISSEEGSNTRNKEIDFNGNSNDKRMDGYGKEGEGTGENNNHNIISKSINMNSPLLSSHISGVEVEDSIADSPPSLDFEGDQNENEIETDVEGSENENQNAAEDPEREKVTMTKGNESIECPYCNKTFSLKTQLNGHVWIHRKRNRMTKRLTLVRKPKGREVKEKTKELTSSPSSIRRRLDVNIDLDDAIAHHHNNQPTKPTEFEVAVSAYQKRKVRKLEQRAQRRERETKKRPFACNQCQYSAVSKISLVLHVRMAHQGVECHSCQFCWKTFPAKNRRSEHYLTEHKDKYKQVKEKKTGDKLQSSS